MLDSPPQPNSRPRNAPGISREQFSGSRSGKGHPSGHEFSPAHKNYELAALPGGGKSPLPAKESNFTVIVSQVMTQEIGSKWGADVLCPISPTLIYWSKSPDLKGGQEKAYITTIGGICKLSKCYLQRSCLIEMR
ncbi:hypothetical protein DSO57_1007035 [Entomophthora muscae]|uniref:Uncharacterized protein n=1 Tax=Entomophthora muscae TaxID=34485 RepID=A0ACC2RME4_9FUNG|nr:hypothetical protein DSO57_1007035 [Entomophthora muscae]